MPLAGTGDVLGTTISTAVTGLSAANKAIPEKVWQEVARAVVAHILANLVVTTPVDGAPVPGVVT